MSDAFAKVDPPPGRALVAAKAKAIRRWLVKACPYAGITRIRF
jgi:hypothetical protein